MDYQDILKVALDAADVGAQITKGYFGKITHVDHKPNAGLVTVADRESEQAIIKIIHSKFPDHQIIAEESGEKKSTSKVRWIIDPLDGTTNYAHQVPLYCICIGVEVEGELVVGVIDAPLMKERFIGVKGNGATLNGTQIRVSRISELKDALLTTGFSYKKGQIVTEEIERLRNVLHEDRAVRRLGSAALDMSYTACGRFDGFWEVDLSPWDVAAGTVIIREAGGTLTDFSGNPYDPFGTEIVATNGLIHEQLRSILPLR